MPVVIPRLIVEVFQHPNFEGRSGFVLEPVRDTRHIGFQDVISSVRVYKGPNFKSSPSYRVIFHEHFDFKGKKLALGPGFYPNLHDLGYNFGDIISSISFGSSQEASGPTWGTVPLIVECYRNTEFRGRKVTVLRDIAHTNELGIHDAISSVRIFKGPDFPRDGAEVIFFEHVDFEGRRLPIRMDPMDYKKELPNLHLIPDSFGDIISSIKIEGWSSSGEFTEIVFDDEFVGNNMRRQWKWEDPKSGGTWAERQGYLEMRCDPGQDLWHGNPPGQGGNMDAPRLLMEVSGDFAIECRIRVSPELKEHGGLIVWKGPGRFLRLEKTSGPHGFRGDVRFERHVNRRFVLVGRGHGLVRVRELYLRIERRGNLFSGFASPDGINWKSCGQTNVGMGDPIQVGLHALCPGNIPPTLTRFEYFRLFKRKSEVAEYSPAIARSAADAVGRPSDDARRSRRDLRRQRAMRDLT